MKSKLGFIGILLLTLVLVLTLLPACGGGGGSTTPTPTGPFTIGGSITGLTGSGLVLRNNGGDDLTVAASSTSYAFTTSIANGGSYNVTILTQPAGQVCTLTGSSGSISGANVTSANVSCVNAYTIGGTIISSVAGIGPTLQNNLGDNLFTPAIINGNTLFTFSTRVASGGPYSVTQLSRARAPTQNCVVTNGSGFVASAIISNVTVTCTVTTATPKYAYVANNTADTVSAYTIGGTGALTAAVVAPTVASGDGPYSVSVEPGGRFAYVANSNADTISGYSIDTAAGTDTGALTALTDVDAGTPGNQTSIATGDFPISITVHPSGKFAYTVNQGVGATGNTISAYSINVTSGALSAMDADGVTTGTQATIATGTLPYAITVDPTGNFAYVANYTSGTISAYTINQTTGALTTVASYTAGGGPSSVAINPAGTCALVANNTSDNIMSYMINTTTGALGLASTVAGAALSAPRSVAVDPDTGLFAYVANAGGAPGSVSAFSVNPADCVIASIDTDAVTALTQTTIAAGTAPISVNVDPSGAFVYVANFGSNNVSVYSIGGGGALTPGSPVTTATGTFPTSVTTTQ